VNGVKSVKGVKGVKGGKGGKGDANGCQKSAQGATKWNVCISD